MKAVKTALKTITVRVPPDLHQEAKLLSVRKGESLNGIINAWLRTWVEHEREEDA
jgi:predicted HicB family RNase H-like nuclease